MLIHFLVLTPLTKKVALKSRNSLIAPSTKRWMWNQNSQHWLWEIWYMEMWGFTKAKAWKHCSRFRSYKFIYKSRCVPNFKIEWWWIGIAGIFSGIYILQKIRNYANLKIQNGKTSFEMLLGLQSVSSHWNSILLL